MPLAKESSRWIYLGRAISMQEKEHQTMQRVAVERPIHVCGYEMELASSQVWGGLLKLEDGGIEGDG